MKPKYVFIVGMPRTGTKLMISILTNASSERFKISPETRFVGGLLGIGIRHKIRKFGNLSEESNARAAVDYMFSNQLKWTYWDHLQKGKLGIDRGKMVDALLDSDQSDRAIFDILMRIQPGVTDDTIIGEKTPGHLYHVSTLLDWFPEAKIIHTFRDPRAILASEWLRRMKKRPANLATKLTNPFYSFFIVVHVIVTWKYAVRLHNKYKKRYPQNYFLSIFEDLVREPEKQVRSLCQFLEIDFTKDMLSPNIFGSSYSVERSSGFDEETLTRWKHQLKPWMKALLFIGRAHSYKI